MKRVLAGVLLLLSGCQIPTEQGFEVLMKQYVGMSEEAAIDKLGVPTKSYLVGSAKYISFTKGGTSYSPGVAPTLQSNVIGNTVYTTRVGGIAPSVSSYECTVEFKVSGGKIVAWRYEGNACRA